MVVVKKKSGGKPGSNRARNNRRSVESTDGSTEDHSERKKKETSKMSKNKKKVSKMKKKPATVEDVEDKGKEAATTNKNTVSWDHTSQKAVEFYIAKYAAKGVTGILEEYKNEIANYTGPKDSHKTFNENAARNRSKDVICLDETRVKLPSPQTYIHANIISEPEKTDRKYFLTQAPMENTIEDFWRMCYEHKVMAIIMLCGFKEFDKECSAEYYPLKQGDFKNYGQMFVANKKMEEISKETVYTLEVLPEGCSNSHILYIVTYDQWPQHLSQAQARNVLKATRLIATLDTLASGPIVAMDSLGVSRAAILILVDFTITYLYQGNVMEMVDMAKWLRRQRAGAITNEQQYLFAVQTVAEYIFRAFGDKFTDEYKKLGADDDPSSTVHTPDDKKKVEAGK